MSKNPKAFYWLVIAIFVLWSMGRVVNPTLRAFAKAGSVPDLFFWAVAAYALLHALVFCYTLWLLWQEASSSRRGRGKAIMLYCYVLAALVLSLGFISYEFGFLPGWIVQSLPYPFDVSQ